MATKDTLPEVPGDEMGAADDRLASLPSFEAPRVELEAKASPVVAEQPTAPGASALDGAAPAEASADQLAAMRAVVQEVTSQPGVATPAKAEAAPASVEVSLPLDESSKAAAVNETAQPGAPVQAAAPAAPAATAAPATSVDGAQVTEVAPGGAEQLPESGPAAPRMEPLTTGRPVVSASAGVRGGSLPDAAAALAETGPATQPGLALPQSPAQDAMIAALRSVVQEVMSQSKAKPGRYSADDLARVAGRLSNLKTGIRPEDIVARPDDLPALMHPVQSQSGRNYAAAPAASGPMVAATPGEAAQMRGASLLGEGVRALAGGSASLVGAALKGLGRATHAVADLAAGPPAAAPEPLVQPRFDNAASAGAIAEVQRLMEEFGLTPDDVVEPGDVLAASNKLTREAQPAPEPAPTREAPAPMTAVLPRLSEYRIGQVEKAAEAFGREQDAFWSSSNKLTALRSEMERLAKERGLSISDVTEKMKPGGDFAELREKFNAAVAENPDASTRKRAMDKALDSFVRQYGRAQEEVLNPEQEGNPHYEGLKKRLESSHDSMKSKTAGVPAFANANGSLEASHFEKLREAVKQIMERVKAVVQDFMAMLKGKKSEPSNEVEPS
jgi:hypothetical protein